MAVGACKVLMVDDSEDDRALFRVALRKAGPYIDLLEPVFDGEQAIAYLSGQDRYADRTKYPYPQLLLLDLKMPGKNGFDVLEWLGQQPERPLTVILSGSDQERDVQMALSLGAHHYQVKPSELNDWVATARKIEGFARAGTIAA